MRVFSRYYPGHGIWLWCEKLEKLERDCSTNVLELTDDMVYKRLTTYNDATRVTKYHSKIHNLLRLCYNLNKFTFDLDRNLKEDPNFFYAKKRT